MSYSADKNSGWERGAIGPETKKRQEGKSRLLDLLVIFLCLSGAATGLILFRLDLFRTINSRDQKPIGTIIIKNNVVQRRLGNRVLWDRLFTESPVYLGDLIRVAELSAASLHIGSSGIDLDENTLIRLEVARDGLIRLELTQGSMSLDTADGDIELNLMGRRLKAGPGTVLNASSGDDGIVLAISEGLVVSIDDGTPEGRGQEFPELMTGGTAISFNAAGIAKMQSAALMSKPRPNARYLKSGPEDLTIAFAWSRINLDAGEALRLEIARDRNFAQVFRVLDNLDSRTDTALGEGLWYWRLLFDDAELSSGQIIVVDASGPLAISPPEGRTYRYRTVPPQLSFQWSKKADASYYILEASNTADFLNPQLMAETDSVSFMDSSLGPGTWYWRVMPVFPPVYEGGAEFSAIASFRIEEGEELEGPAWPVLAEAEPAEEDVPALEAVPAPVEIVSRQDPPAAIVQSAASPVQRTVPPPAAAPPPQSRPAAPVTEQAAQAQRAAPGQEVPMQEAPMQEVPRQDPPAAAPVQSMPATPQAEPEAPVLVVQPLPLLPAPAQRLPQDGSRIGIEELRTQRSINFEWSAVPGANAYIFSLYQITDYGRRQIISAPPRAFTEWKLESFSAIDRGSFVWLVEAVRVDGEGVIERRGRVEENSFIIDIPMPRRPTVTAE